MQFEIVEIGKNQLLTFLKIAQRYNNQVVVIPSKETIDFKFIEPALSALGHLQFKNGIHAQVKHIVDQMEKKPFELNIKDMIKILSHVKNQLIVMNAEIAEDGELMGLNFIVKNKDTNEIDKEIQIPIFGNEQRTDFSTIQYGEGAVNFSIKISDMTDAISEASEYQTDEISLVIDKRKEDGQITFTMIAVDKDNLRKKIQIIKKNGEDFTLLKDQDPQFTKATFNIDYMKSLITQGADYTDLIVTFQSKAPLTVQYHNTADSNLKCILAPKKE